jgi:hypothetical protein
VLISRLNLGLGSALSILIFCGVLLIAAAYLRGFGITGALVGTPQQLYNFELDLQDDHLPFSLPEELDRRITRNGKIQGVVRLEPAHLPDRGDTLRLTPDAQNSPIG